MAVTSIWPIKGRLDRVINYVRNPEKVIEKSYQDMSALHAVEDVLEYAVNDMKTEERKYVSCIGFAREEAALEKFINIQKLYGKTDGRICYHGYQSFKENEVTAEQAHEIGVKLAENLWGDRYYVVVATHLNTGHFHNHFVINSVSHIDGMKFHNTKEDYRLMRQESDRLCKECGLSVITQTEGKAKSYAEWQAEKTGKLTQRDLIRKDIDIAIKASVTRQQFMNFMENMGYEFKLYTSSGDPIKYPGLKPPGAKGFYRFHKLGDRYNLPQIAERISNMHEKSFHNINKERINRRGKLRGSHKRVKHKGLYALYLRYCYELGILKKNRTPVKNVSFKLREDIIRMDKYMEQSRLLGKYNIETMEQLSATKQILAGVITSFLEERKEMQGYLKREEQSGEENRKEFIKNEISKINEHLKNTRKEVKILGQIEQRSLQVKENLGELEKQKYKEQQEEKEHEYKLGCSRTTR